jgi:2'-5' RNA ligase
MGRTDATNWEEYNQRVSAWLTLGGIKQKTDEVAGPAHRFRREETGEWRALARHGYTITTPPFLEERDLANVATYARLADIQQAVTARLGLGRCSPVPVTSFHFTIVGLASGTTYEEKVSGLEETALRQAVSACFDGLQIRGTIPMEIRGLALFSKGVVIALAGARDEGGYQRLQALRQALYGDDVLRRLGVQRKHRFMGHVTMCYIEHRLESQDRAALARSLTQVNEQFFANPLPFNVTRAELRKFDDLSRFYREDRWPILEIG